MTIKKNGFQLQDSDVELLAYVFVLRLATIDHLASLSGRSVRALWGRLLKLREQRYLGSVARFMQKRVYAIGAAGVPVLIEAGYAPEGLKEKRLRHNELTEIGIRHSLLIADIHTCLLLQTRNNPIKLTHWEEGQTLWDSVIPDRGESAVPIRPDAYFILTDTALPEGQGTLHVFLEADRSTMSHERMASKIVGFLAYYKQGRYSLKYPNMRAFLVATVTRTRSRADELRKNLNLLIPKTARRAYQFIAVEDISLSRLLPKAPGENPG